MTTYNELAGFRVNYLSSDPTLNSGNEGQVWYNSTSGQLKSLVQIKSWSAGGNLSTARQQLAGAGTQTAGLGFGGNTGSVTAATEEYNGTSWAAGGNLGTARRGLGGAGTQTAGLAFGGGTTVDVVNTEEYDGSSWTAGGNMTTARRLLGGCGTQTVGLAFGGITTVGVNDTEEYDGSVWSTGGALITARCNLGVTGTQNAALAVTSGNAESYNGTVWSAAPSSGACASCGKLVGGTGGAVSPLGYIYNGTTWARVNNIAGTTVAYAGTPESFIGVGSNVSPYTQATIGGPGVACCCLL